MRLYHEDAADERLAAADDALNDWLAAARRKIGGGKSEVVFVSVNKVWTGAGAER